MCLLDAADDVVVVSAVVLVVVLLAAVAVLVELMHERSEVVAIAPVAVDSIAFAVALAETAAGISAWLVVAFVAMCQFFVAIVLAFGVAEL